MTHGGPCVGVARASVVVLLMFGSACTGLEPEVVDGDTAFVGVHLIDVAAGTTVQEQTVVVRDGRIVDIAPTADVSLASGVEVVDGDGKYLAPGLMDMHAHATTANKLVLNLANGVTTVRNMWGEASILDLRDSVAAGRIPGPRLVTAGPLVDGAPASFGGALELTDPAKAEQVVADQASDGYDFVKIYSNMSPKVFDAVIAAAAAHGMEVSGHLPQDVPLAHALDSGMVTMEHLIGLVGAVLRDDRMPNPDLGLYDPRAGKFVAALGRGEIDPGSLVDEDRIAAVAEHAARVDVWFVPTLVAMKNFTSDPAPRNLDADRFLSPATRAVWAQFRDPAAISQEMKRGEDIIYALRLRMLAALHEAGAKILVGTDANVTNIYPGFTVVDEIIALTDVGLSNVEALRAATLQPGIYLGRRGELGEIVEGAEADLILIDGDPFADLDALRQPTGVMQAGVWRTRGELDEMLEAVAAKTATEEAAFDSAPVFAPQTGAPIDFLSVDGNVVRVAAANDNEERTTITAAMRNDGGWATYVATVTKGSIIIESDGEATIRLQRSENRWVLQGRNDVVGTAADSELAVVLTDTPMDIPILNAVVGPLEEGATRNIVVWNCRLELSCQRTDPQPMTVRGLGRKVIHDHYSYTAADGYQLRRVGDEEEGGTDYWVSQGGFSAGQPIRSDVDGVQTWRRIR